MRKRIMYHVTSLDGAKKILKNGFQEVQWGFLTDSLKSARLWAPIRADYWYIPKENMVILEVEVDSSKLIKRTPGNYLHRGPISASKVKISHHKAILERNPISPKRREFLRQLWLRQSPGFSRGILNKEIELQIDSWLETMAKIDPTSSGEYCPWLFKLLQKGNIRLPEDAEKLSEALTHYHKIKKHIPQNERDINRLESYAKLRQLLEKFGGAIGRREAKRMASREGQKLLGQEGPLSIWEVTSAEASADLARHTGWCVKDPKYSLDYLKEGPLYFVFKTIGLYGYVCGHCGFSPEVIETKDLKEKYTPGELNGSCNECSQPIQIELRETVERPYALAHASSKQVMNVDDEPVSEGMEDEIIDLFRKYAPSVICQKHNSSKGVINPKAGFPIRDCESRYCDNPESCPLCLVVCSDSGCSKEVCNKCSKTCKICDNEACDKHSYECSECGNYVCEEHRVECGYATYRCTDCTSKCDICQEEFCTDDPVSFCSICERNICENCGGTIICDSCQEYVCDTDRVKCTACQNNICKTKESSKYTCIKECHNCSDDYCADCVEGCSSCKELLCASCQETCEKCELVFCEDCLEDNTCSSCREEEEEKDIQEIEKVHRKKYRR